MPANPKGDTLNVTIAKTSLGLALVAQSGAGLTAVLLGDNRTELRNDLQQRFPDAQLIDATANDVVASVVDLIESPARRFTARLDLRGTEFQQKVWKALREIPAGATATYTAIAKRIGQPKSARAVAQACAANHVAVAVPCHRVIRSDGQLSGYRWGVARKRALLDREALSSRR
jgi:AraC family transcriptional regulator of adaptative response/methylated-DNA-[protein]-cysteine methyltransferase